ncbi:AbrB/MazE/SpoVT family DNA-binding domain-containing protein [Bacillus thuringiensis]|uniref:AbrB/MazE/SpoVT family DNA-binding domain-containing protein n=1 Tax=Bacillus cereus group TaxID=86661 RepID=UPI0007884337|nr:AbrB/MazE/SpoVT family DNA-binding domain-containing protein [Bacillus thuringiensis]AMR88308.1 AbrB family transcriptional regulator [Bacillus thuringiensis]MBG9637453.1 AbrB family transcriptional regulator [Bacillus thuringiensis]MBG9673983.1 AbrB family transcriptional regulator [Bacillus thuringiensis]MEC3299337.1 AbrB/MazE/SpoVT family DNA-binding domain-containing protein [Bacillus thuringiensis]MEC3403039.1 AbrB/MazE/SpoVT family DNA-binding domain-containing protein [Bacillus thuri
MKSTGMTRKVDELGRVVLPIELRRTLGIVEKDPIEIFVEDDKIILQKYQPQQACMITSNISDNNISLVNGKIILSPEGAEMIIQELQQYLVRS